ncbi:hypothetical protein BDP27DRAFT_1366711 [Rhodocollybia butyracea]|uniref:Uncharacterized protein n=1 Tax=Rhodocollybia butyracea TaxID=206335 RepID=A0A9P5U3N6_9AGAR|nr:hypothetical protein BDP27DRAFT_1366711 [Rhodocollybia butyracea]
MSDIINSLCYCVNVWILIAVESQDRGASHNHALQFPTVNSVVEQPHRIVVIRRLVDTTPISTYIELVRLFIKHKVEDSKSYKFFSSMVLLEEAYKDQIVVVLVQHECVAQLAAKLAVWDKNKFVQCSQAPNQRSIEFGYDDEIAESQTS